MKALPYPNQSRIVDSAMVAISALIKVKSRMVRIGLQVMLYGFCEIGALTDLV
jgi:hypothetical protein